MSKQGTSQTLDWDFAVVRSHLGSGKVYFGYMNGWMRPELPRRRPVWRSPHCSTSRSQMNPKQMDSILGEVEDKIFANSTLYLSPRFFGYINSGGNQASVVGELLASAVNQICALWHFSPAASEVERRVVCWIAEFIGYSSEAGGCLLSGGSAGNLVGLAVARRQRAQFDMASLGMRGAPPLTVYVSQEGHASLDKAMVLLGMGRSQLRKIAVRDDFTIDLDSLERQVAEDRKNGCQPICVVGNAGTTNTGSVDPVDALSGVLRGSKSVVSHRRCLRRTCRTNEDRWEVVPRIGACRFHRSQPP